MTSAHSIKVGISSCLLGERVRFDGAHKNNDYIKNTLGQYFEWVLFCPEVSAGLGIPRTPMHLVRHEQGVHVVTIKGDKQDHTLALAQVIEQITPQLPLLSGYILKKDSPSCGMERVKVYDAEQPHRYPPERNGVGAFAAALQAQFPNLPLEEEGRLGDPGLRENFITRVYVYKRWQNLMSHSLKTVDLVNFHADHKYLLMAHHQDELRQLGQLVASVGKHNIVELAQVYITRLMQLLRSVASRGQHANVLSHLMGYLKDHLDSADREELVEMIGRYQQGYIPRIVPITLLKHHFRRHPHPYIERQYYLNAHPGELMLLNEI